ncbi:MAG: hypothetical protein AB8G05_19740 [Oligoflexales bacterium]
MPSCARKIAYLAIFLNLLDFTFSYSNTIKKPIPSTNHIKNIQKKILHIANRLMEDLPISYVYGGSQVTSINSCQSCTECLLHKSPRSKNRLIKCPSCKNCSLDCSHFTQLVYKLAGLDTPYLDTRSMLNINPRSLLKNYHLVSIPHLSLAQAGDLLVYKGHVVILERAHNISRGDIIHATGGKDIKEPGQGIQRERNVIIQSFRGQLKRIFRHKKLIPRHYEHNSSHMQSSGSNHQ